ncbi:phage virion morphogenesis protein [Laribacter hongkongensis]|uniref:phage virion morphogenesis protein n=1 Tax=Laribacter hongkongensis TaxID=168471 RepID=UPI001EFC30CF|nr:phage virion morphogenesis protein [Laribacter hongkongensis]MCG9124968.1 phage virion morphogenesis protein [Laribacter hongkongensis]
MSLAVLESELAGLLQQTGPAARRQLAREIGRELRRSQQKRIAAQQNPDGSRFAPRKPQLRQRTPVRRQMFTRLRTARYLQLETTPEAVAIAFVSSVARIAKVHQFGEEDEVRPGLTARYPARELLGMTEEDIGRVQEAVLRHLADG